MKRGFTLIELVFVIVIIGILSAILAPRFDRPTLTEAAHQLVSHIRYTQHLAMMDDKFDPVAKFWHRERWQLQFGRSKYTNNQYAYSIYSDKIGTSGGHTGNPDLLEIAKNPLNNGQLLSGGYSSTLKYNDARATKNMNLGEKYGILDVKFTKGCNSGKRVAFDYLGRPIKGNISKIEKAYTKSNMVKKRCIIQLCLDDPCKLKESDRFIEIAIEAETGYTHIL